MTSGKWQDTNKRYPKYVPGHQCRGRKFPPKTEKYLVYAREWGKQQTLKALASIVGYCQDNGLDMINFIRDEYSEKSLKQIAEEWGVSRITLTKWMDKNGILRRSMSESIALNWATPSVAMIQQTKKWQEKGRAWMCSEEGREFNRQRCLENNPASSPEARQKISESKQGEKNASWNGGTGYLPYPLAFNRKLKRKIHKRDGYICQECGKEGNQTHHIDYNKENQDPLNLITLCKCCHTVTNFNREQWMVHFQAMMSNRFELETP